MRRIWTRTSRSTASIPAGRLYSKAEAFMSKIAEFYAGEIVSPFPDGPYVIGGNCHGAKVAVKIARILMETGRRVEKLCFLEYPGTNLHDFDGQLLLMYGTQSHRREYRAIRWGAPGWRAPFRRPPVVELVSGEHGQFFHGSSSLQRPKPVKFEGDSPHTHPDAPRCWG